MYLYLKYFPLKYLFLSTLARYFIQLLEDVYDQITKIIYRSFLYGFHNI